LGEREVEEEKRRR